MRFKVAIPIIFLACLLISCAHNKNADEVPNVGLEKISHTSEINLDLSNKVKDYLKNSADIKAVHSVNSNNLLVLAIEVPQVKRFNLKKISKKIKKNLENKFKDSDIYLSTDKKVIIELDQLEHKINQASITKKELNKELKRIIELMNAKT